MAEFQASLEELAQIKTSVYAYSTDTVENTKKIVEENGYTFPIITGLDRLETVEKLGAYHEEKRNILHANNFVLRRDKIMSLTISNGPIGRLTAADAVRFITFNQKREAGG